MATIPQLLAQAIHHHQSHRLPEAENLYQQILQQNPNHPAALHYLGVLARQSNNPDRAITLIRRSLALDPHSAEAHYNLANALRDKKRLAESAAAYQQALALQPHYPAACNNLGTVLLHQNLPDEALNAFRQALALQPIFPDACNNLGNVFTIKRRFPEAAAAYQQSLAFNPHNPEVLNNLANALRNLGQFDDAIAAAQQALALKPAFSEALSNLAGFQKDIGRLDQSLASFRRALTLNPDLRAAHDNLLYTLLFHPDSTPQSLFAEAQRWNLQFAQPLRNLIQPHPNNRDPHRPLRIAYLSPDLRDHPVGRFLLPLLQHHNPAHFQIFCYAHNPPSPVPDPLTEKLKSHVHTWRDILLLTDDQSAELIRQDQIDILVDLTLHLQNNRLLILARKPAPLQLTYLGYLAGTALDTIDYRLTTPDLDLNPAEEKFYFEKPLHLTGPYWCYHPPLEAPEVNPLPALQNNHITFGCLNNYSKVTEPTLKTWATLLQKNPTAHLLLHVPSGSARTNLQIYMHSQNIPPTRLHLLPRLSLQDYFQTHHRIDIALDPFPYAGGTTSCDALFMGLPLITLAGPTPTARAGVHLLNTLHLPHLIAHTPDQYIHLATTLAQDLPQLTALRATLRQKMQSSPLMNAPLFTQSIESAYRQIWQTWCTTPAAPSPEPLQEGRDYYLENGLFVFTQHYLLRRGHCCQNACRHCPYGFPPTVN